MAWVAERRDVLSGLFFVLTLGAWLGYLRHGRTPGRYLLVAVLFALGLMAKPMVVTLPALLLLLDFWPLRPIRWGRRHARLDSTRSSGPASAAGAGKAAAGGLARGDCLMTLRTHAQCRRAAGLVGAVWQCGGFLRDLRCFSFSVRSIWRPITPSAGRSAGVESGGSNRDFGLAVSAAAVIWRRRCPYGFVGWFWYLGMLSPVLGLVKIAGIAMADRYMYLPGIGLSHCTGLGSEHGWPPLGPRGVGCWVPAREWRSRLLVACATWQTSFWRDDETLWRRALGMYHRQR